MKNSIILFSFFLLLSCSESNRYESLALAKAKEKDCSQEIELLLTHENTELWASYSKKDSSLLCLYTCVNDVCIFSTEKD